MHILWRHSFVFVADTEVIMEVLITRLSLVLWNLHNSNLICPNPGRREKIKLNLYFHTFCGASKGFMKALKVAFILQKIEKFLIFLFVLCFPITRMIVAKSAKSFSWLVPATISPFSSHFSIFLTPEHIRKPLAMI